MDRSNSKDSRDLAGSSSSSSGNALFDASQYEFFGQESVEEVELGGLDELNDLPRIGFSNDEYQLFEKDEGAGLGSLSDMDDLASTFFKLNKVVTGPRNPGVIGDRGSGSFSRESSSVSDWQQDGDFNSWLDQHMISTESEQEGKRWSSQPHLSSAHLAEVKPLYRTASYPQEQPHDVLFSSEPSLGPDSSFTSFPPPGGGSLQTHPHQLSRHLSIPSLNNGPQLPFSTPTISPLSNSNFNLAALSHAYSGNIAQFSPKGFPLKNQPQNRWISHAGILHGDNSNLMSNILQQQMPLQSSLLSSQSLPFQNQLQQQLRQQILLQQAQPSLAHLQALQSQFINTQLLSPHKPFFGIAGMREPRHKSSQRSKHRSSQQGSEISSQKSESVWAQFRSKYMTGEEIESVLKMQHSSGHSNDPYVNDYYRQARLAKKSTGSRLKFCPAHLRELPSRGRNSGELQNNSSADSFGKTSFSSLRKLRSLLDVDHSPIASGDSSEQCASDRSLVEEPMFAARIAIEDALGALLDVEDIDRILQFSPPQDGGVQLRRKRQILLEGLATSLQLVDPLGKSGHSGTLTSKDDIVFLRLISIPKGRKFLSKYLKLIFHGSELARIVCMAIFRHLRFLFGGMSSDPTAAEATNLLAKTVCSCISGMDLRALSACLVAVVCSSEQPPLRPIGSLAGDEASVILRCVLEKATSLLTDPHAAANCSNSNRALWQASFDEFFGLLTKYCLSKYDTMRQSICTQAPPSTSIMSPEIARAVSREMPVELLRASLPHTNEQQRKILLDFANRAKPATEINPRSGSSGHISSEFVRS
ncbi:unnamed protein product [Rhodiola kirilowii]